ncbi:MAG: hypothetical protein R3C03_14280 [Pirellulaceae bacterium]
MSRTVILSAIAALVFFTSTCEAQGLFGNGSGNSTPWWKFNKSQSDTELGSLYNGRAFVPKGEKGTGLGSLFSSGNNDGETLFSMKRPSWLPKRDPDSPSAFQQMSDRSRTMWNNTAENFSNWRAKTSENFRNANQNFRESTSETWQRMTGSLSMPSLRSSETSDEPRPELRSANNWFGRGDRYE